MWTTPKVNWKPTDYYNIEDWTRVRTNLEHLCSYLIDTNRGSVTLLITHMNQGYEEIPYVAMVNNMEENLANLQETFGVAFTENVSKKTWYDRLDIMYQNNPNYTDWNRWETILLRVYESLQYLDSYVFSTISGTCRSGSERTLIRFSRGR